MSIYKACDIRGKFGSELQVRHASGLGQAIFALKGPVPVLVGGDGRNSTPVLKSALIDSLVQSGCKVIDLGMVPTPLIYFARQRLGIETAVMVTASHNPAADNGFKVSLGPLPITPEEIITLSHWMESDSAQQFGPAGESRQVNLLAEYIDFVSAFVPDLTGQKVVVDCANGMAGLVARQVWQKTGAALTFLLEEVDGSFPVHPPNQADPKNLQYLQQAVHQIGADLGVAYDGDADRTSFVDECGQPAGADKVIVLFARRALRGGPANIVFDQKCSRIVPDTIRAMHGNPIIERSGHTYIQRSFQTLQAAYAGELSGHHFFKPLEGDDGLIASLIFAGIVKESNTSPSALLNAIPSYPITPEIRLPMQSAEIARLIDTLEASFEKEALVTKMDGLRIDFDYGWGLIRPSVTEPVVTMRFEGVDEPSLRNIIAKVEESYPSLSGKLLR